MTQHPHAHERGIALILVVLFTLAMSAVGGSMMVLARTEAISSANYRMMSQARYGAESGVHRAIHFLLNSYAKPGTAGMAVLGAGSPMLRVKSMNCCGESG